MGLAGLEDNAGLSMFEHLRPPDMKPSEEDIEEQAEKMRYNKTVVTKSFNVKTYDLGNDKDAKAYAKCMLDIYVGIQARTHVILFNERKFVSGQDGSHPRWIAHIEWAVYELVVTVNEPVSSAEEGAQDAKDK
jgi:hypothetical protein